MVPAISVALLIQRGDDLLLGRDRRTDYWGLPEGVVLAGECLSTAARRAARDTVGLGVGTLVASRNAPYVSTFGSGRLYLTFVLVAEYAGGEPNPLSPFWAQVAWYSEDRLPELLAPTARQIFSLAEYNASR